jgi:hypothetical protein
MKIIYEQDDHEHVAVMAVKGGADAAAATAMVPKGKRFKLVADDAEVTTHDFAADSDGTGTHE